MRRAAGSPHPNTRATPLAGTVPAVLLAFLCHLAAAATYYVDAVSGSDANGGTATNDAWQTLAKLNGATFAAGDLILLNRGDTWAEDLSVSDSGAPGNPIVFGAYGTGAPPQIRRLTTSGAHTTFENLLIDHAKNSGDAVRLQSATNCVLRGLTVRNGTSDGLDADKADGLLIDGCLIHHFLAGSFTNQADAHGIVTTDTDGLTIRNTEVHHVTGDSFQTDPDRDTDTPNNILIEDCHFWTGPLETDFNSQWHAGERPGENAIDTKMVTENWDPLPRMRITLRNIHAHGWKKDGYIGNKAVFNMKEKIEAVFDGVTVYDSEIAFRLRGTRGNADVTIRNAAIYDCEHGIRAEDDLANLVLQNCTFGHGITNHITYAGGSGGTGTWTVQNNAFVGAKPSVASDPDNLVASASDFTNSAARDYHLLADSPLRDAGTLLEEVPEDRDGLPRVQGPTHDTGAYEYHSSATSPKPSVHNAGAQAGHYLRWHGKPLLLIGDSVTQGWMESGTNFNHRGYVEALATNGANVLMVWAYIGTKATAQQSDARIGYDAPEIWPWEGSPDDGTFDLTQLNRAYFSRLKELVGYAERHNVVVLLCIHDGWPKSRFDRHPFNAALGNGPLTNKAQYVALAEYGTDVSGPFDSGWARARKNQYFQEQLCARLIEALAPFSNVIYEMFNEGEWYDSTQRNQHEQHFLGFFRARCTNLLLTNSDHISGDDPHNDTKVDLITRHPNNATWSGFFGTLQTGFNGTPAKPYFVSEPVPSWDGTNISLDDVRRSIWESALAGAGWVNQNDASFGWDTNAALAAQAANRDTAYEYAGHCAVFFDDPQIGLADMRPQGGLAGTGICMADAGTEYVVYTPTNAMFTVDLSAATGKSLAIRWFDPRTGAVQNAGTVPGGAAAEPFTPPFSPDSVLHLKHQPGDPTPAGPTGLRVTPGP